MSIRRHTRRKKKTRESSAQQKFSWKLSPVEQKVAASDATSPSPAPIPDEAAAGNGAKSGLGEKHISIAFGETGHSYESVFGPYLRGASEIAVEDPFIRKTYQLQNFLHFCELVVKVGSANRIDLITGYDDEYQKGEAQEKFQIMAASLKSHGITLSVNFEKHLHDREIRLDNGWVIKIGRGFDFYQKPESSFAVGLHYSELRPCRKTTVDIFRS